MLTRRQIVLGSLVVIAAMPLIWLTADQNAGDKLLRWTSSASNKTSMSDLPSAMPHRSEAPIELIRTVA